MKMQVSGTVTKLSNAFERTSKQGKTFYNFYVGVNGSDYSFMSNGQQLLDTNNTPISEGSEVMFTATQNGEYLNGDSKTLFVQNGGQNIVPTVQAPAMAQAPIPIVQAPSDIKPKNIRHFNKWQLDKEEYLEFELGVQRQITTQSQVERCVELLIASKDTDPTVKKLFKDVDLVYRRAVEMGIKGAEAIVSGDASVLDGDTLSDDPFEDDVPDFAVEVQAPNA